MLRSDPNPPLVRAHGIGVIDPFEEGVAGVAALDFGELMERGYAIEGGGIGVFGVVAGGIDRFFIAGDWHCISLNR